MLFEVSYNEYKNFITNNNLTEKINCMHIEWYDNENKLVAIAEHGIAYTRYMIEDEPNTETINLICYIIESKTK